MTKLDYLGGIWMIVILAAVYYGMQPPNPSIESVHRALQFGDKK